MKQFEYRIIKPGNDEKKLIENLNNAGKEGCDLIPIIWDGRTVLIGKREIESPEPVKKPSGSINGFSR